jgi:hypothetical protein
VLMALLNIIEELIWSLSWKFYKCWFHIIP